LFCYGDEDSMATMFAVLDRQQHIPKLNWVMLNWVYDTFVMQGWKIIYKTDKFKEGNYFFNPYFEYDIATDMEQITPKEFINKMLECFDDKFVYLPILQFSAMMLMNVWPETVKTPIYPALMFTWETGRGKSTIVAMLKAYSLHTGKWRELTLSGKSASPQPVRKSATDNSILFLEEVTGEVNPAVEQWLRGIVNRDKWAVGLTWWKNAYYNFRSPLIALWQRTFVEDSINNRFAILDMDHQKKKWSIKNIQDLQTKYSCTDFIFKMLYENWGVLKSLHEKYAEKLVKEKIWDRQRDVLIFAFIMNEFLEVDIKYEILLEHCMYHLRNIWLDKPRAEISREWLFKSVLIEWIMQKKIMGTYSDIDNNNKMRYELFFSWDFLERNRAKIFSAVAYFNDKSREEWRDDCLRMSGTMLTITYRTTSALKVDVVLDAIMNRVSKTSRQTLHYVPVL